MSRSVQVVLVDNYDSFTHNIVHALWRAGAGVTLVRHDLAAGDILALDGDGWLVGPGPCTPDQSLASLELCRVALSRPLPLLGICLGHQCIARAAGAEVRPARTPAHGKLATIVHHGDGLMSGMPRPFRAARYHSLAVGALPDTLVATAWSDDGDVMALRHRTLPVEGLQFHPESHLCPGAARLFDAWIARLASRARTE